MLMGVAGVAELAWVHIFSLTWDMRGLDAGMAMLVVRSWGPV